MHIRFSYDERFERLMDTIKKKYGEEILNFSGVHSGQLDMAKFTREFLFNGDATSVADHSVDVNANVDDRSVVSFDHEVSKALNKLNALNMIWKYIMKVYEQRGDIHGASRAANRAIEHLVNGSLYLNDAHFVHKAYCYSFDLYPLVSEGMPFVKKIHIGPPNHYTSMINLVVQATAFISNQIAGAASFPNLLIYLDYFARKDFGEEYWMDPESLDHVQQGLQNLVYSLNFAFRGSQSAFSNISIYDSNFMKELFSDMTYPDGTRVNFESVKMMQHIFMDWYNKESEKQNFTFPVITANHVTEKGKILDEEFLDYAAGANLPFGVLNFYTGPATCLSSCCRLRSELIREHTNSLGTGSISIGSHRVCTINLPRVAIETEGDAGRFAEILADRIHITYDILNAHRAILTDLIAANRLPLYSHGWMHLQKQYSTVGLIGPYETCKFMGMDIKTDEGSAFIVQVEDTINQMNLAEEKRWSDGRRFNLELIPGEQAAIKMCEADKMLYPDFAPLQRTVLYSNQFIPLIEDCDIYTRMRLQGIFDTRAQGGCIAHLNIDHRIQNKEQMKLLIRAMARAGALYFAVNLNIARCADGHVNVGLTKLCHHCGKPITSNRTRVVGFLTDVSDWGKVRKWEYSHRKFYMPETLPGLEEPLQELGGEHG